jgi:hypothetical protein
MLRYARPHGVERDIDASLEEMCLAVDGLRVEASSEEVPTALMAVIEVLGVRGFQPLHPLAEIGVPRLDDQMEMVVHEAVGPAVPTVKLNGACESPYEHGTIQVIEHDPPTFVSSCRDVVDRS